MQKPLLVTSLLNTKLDPIDVGTAFSILIAFGAFLQLNPYIIWHSNIFFGYNLAVFNIALLLHFKKQVVVRKNAFLLIAFILANLCLNLSSKGWTPYINSSIILVSTYLLMNDEYKIKVYEIFRTMFALSLIPGLCIIALNLLNFDLPWEAINPDSVAKTDGGKFYRKYFGSVVLSNQIISTKTGDLFRFSAMYEEPGVVGTISALLIIADDAKLRSYRAVILLLSGILSFSVAFYVLIIGYLLFTKPKTSALAVILCSTLLTISYSQLQKNPFYSKFLLERMNFIIENPVKANNRIDGCFSEKYSKFIHSNEITLGLGAGAHTKTGCNVSSYKVVIYNHGLLGGMAILSMYIYLTSSLINRRRLLKVIPFVLFFSLSMFQRPAFFSIWAIIIFCTPILKTKLEYSASNPWGHKT